MAEVYEWSFTTEREMTSDEEAAAQARTWSQGECEVSEFLGVAGAEWAWGVIGRGLCLISNGTSVSLEDGVTGKRLSITRVAPLLSRDSSNCCSCHCYKEN